MLEFRLKAYRQWQKMTEPTWPSVKYPTIDYQDIIYYLRRSKGKAEQLEEVDPTSWKHLRSWAFPVRAEAAF